MNQTSLARPGLQLELRVLAAQTAQPRSIISAAGRAEQETVSLFATGYSPPPPPSDRSVVLC